MLVAPFLLMADTNRPIEQMKDLCTDTAYNRYGSSSSVQLDMAKYDAEAKKCIDAYIRNFVSLRKLLSAMAGQGERELGLVAWGFILIPPGSVVDHRLGLRPDRLLGRCWLSPL